MVNNGKSRDRSTVCISKRKINPVHVWSAMRVLFRLLISWQFLVTNVSSGNNGVCVWESLLWVQMRTQRSILNAICYRQSSTPTQLLLLSAGWRSISSIKCNIYFCVLFSYTITCPPNSPQTTLSVVCFQQSRAQDSRGDKNSRNPNKLNSGPADLFPGKTYSTQLS